MVNLNLVFGGVVVITFFLIVACFIRAAKTIKLDEEAKKKEVSENFYWFIRGGKPREELVKIGYEYNPLVCSNNAHSLIWPEFETIGGGTREMFDNYLLFGIDFFKPNEKLDFLAIVGWIKEVENWGGLTVKEKSELIKARLEPEYVKKYFT